jgi:N-(5-amino-5-carboxypentanoyl)-L-cysteinyl-D-valine synthase
MVPTRLYRIDGKLPVTTNSKLDVRRLPTADTIPIAEPRSAPHNSLESKLCQIWCAVLGIQRCGAEDDFFKLGGNSISSLQLVAQIYRELRWQVTVRMYSTIEQ